MSGSSPIDQFKINVFSELSFAGLDLSITNSTVFLFLSTISVGLLFYPSKNKLVEAIPSNFQIAQETVFSLISGMASQTIGDQSRKIFPLVFTMFLFIFSANIWGMMPFFSFTTTSHIAVTITLALIIFLSVIVYGVAHSGLKYFAHFIPKDVPLIILPLMIPIELVSFFARPFTLAVRLCGNMVAGHIVLKIFGFFVISLLSAGGILSLFSVLPFIMLLAMNALEFFVAFLQAYIFATLSCIYLSESVH